MKNDMFLCWRDIYVYLECLHDEGCIEDNTHTSLLTKLVKLKTAVVEYDALRGDGEDD